MNPWPKSWPLRVLAGVWSLPVHVVGGLLALAVWPWARWRASIGNGAVELEAKGPLGAWFRNRHWAAATVGIWIACWYPPDARLRSHERRHTAVWLVLGVLFGPVYLLLLLAFGYDDHPMEVDATAHERAS